jgi:hypothetical protein
MVEVQRSSNTKCNIPPSRHFRSELLNDFYFPASCFTLYVEQNLNGTNIQCKNYDVMNSFERVQVQGQMILKVINF